MQRAEGGLWLEKRLRQARGGHEVHPLHVGVAQSMKVTWFLVKFVKGCQGGYRCAESRTHGTVNVPYLRYVRRASRGRNAVE